MKKKNITVYGIFWQHVKRYCWQTIAITLAFIAYNACDVAVPWFYKKFFDTLTLPGQRDSLASGLIAILLTIAGLYILRVAFRFFAERLGNIFVPKLMNDLTVTAYKAISRHSYQFFSNNFSGSLVRKIQRLSYAINSVYDIVGYNVIALFVTVIGATVLLMLRNIMLALMVLVWFVVLVFANYLFSRAIIKHRVARAAKDSEATGVLSDSITNALNIKQYSAFKHEEGLLNRVLSELGKLRTLTWNLQVIAGVFQTLFLVVIELIVMYVAVSLWASDRLTLGDFALIQGLINQLWFVTWGLQHIFRGMYEATADAQEMIDIMNTPYEVVDAPGAKTLTVSDGKIVFDRTKFNYNETREVLRDFSLMIIPKEKIALVGSSGAGKSTIIKLLFRFYDVTGGKILIDGQNIAKVTQESLHNAISMVPQDPLLFHRSLMDNIRYGRREASDEEVYAAAKKAHCHEFISAFSDGYQTLVGERGVKLSGGERQRVAIARAILKNSPILVLDEATSSLDSESEMFIQQALEELMRDKTVIVIAHRLSTIAKMDRIIVMEDGRIIDEGTHTSLVRKRGGVYKKLWSIQAGGFLAEPEAI